MSETKQHDTETEKLTPAQNKAEFWRTFERLDGRRQVELLKMMLLIIARRRRDGAR